MRYPCFIHTAINISLLSVQLTCNHALVSSPPAQILSLRDEKAKLLGFKNYAELSMASKVGGLKGFPVL
jgi:hypothetical protein